MGKTASIRARVKPKKRSAEAALKRLPNAQTRRAIKEAQARKNLECFESASAWAKKMRSL